LLLAMKTGWSRESILALSPAEFHHYLTILTQSPPPDS